MVHEVLAKLFLEASCKFKVRLFWFRTPESNAHCTAECLVISPPPTHRRLRARDHCISSTLIGGKGGAGPSSLPTTLEGPTEYVIARWMWSLRGFLHGIEWIMFQEPSFGGRLNTKPGDYGTLNAQNGLFIHWNSIWLRVRSHMTSHYTRGSVTTQLRDFGGVLGQPLDTFYWVLPIPWSRLLAHVWSGPKGHITHEIEGQWPLHSKIYHLSKQPRSSF
jgi:hypothetical protein